MNNLKKSKLNLLVSLAYQVVAIAMGLIVPRITLTSYGSETNGLLSSALQFVGYLTLFEAGIQAVATKSLYKTVGNDDKDGTNSILSAVNKNYKKIGVYYLLGLIVLSLVYPLFIDRNNLDYVTIVLVVLFSGLSNVVLFFFQGKYRILLQVEGKNYFISLMNIITNIANHGIKIALLSLKVNIAIVVFGSFVASMIPAVIIMLYIKKKYKWIDLGVQPNFAALSQSKDAIIHQVSGMIFSSTDTLLLTIFCDLKVVSVYVTYKLINDYIYSFAKIPFDSISFKLGQLYNTEKDKFKQCINTVELFTSNIFFILFTVTLCLTPTFVSLYTKGVEDINYADSKLAILFVMMQLLNCMRNPMLNTINYAGHYKQTLVPSIIETSINIVVSLVGVIFLGIYGGLLGTIVALLYRTGDIIIYANRKLLHRSPMRTFSYYIVEGILTCAIYFLFNFLNLMIDTYLKFILVGVLLTVSVAIIFILISCLVYREEFSFLRKNLLKNGGLFKR